MRETFMKEKPILPLILSMSLPMVVSMMVNSLYNIVDSFFVAQMGEGAMTALSLVFPVQNLVNAAAIGFGVGVNAVIAFFLGAQQQKRADAAASLGTLCSAVHGLVMMAASLAVMRPFLQAFTDDSQVLAYGMQYSSIVFGFSVVISVELSFEKLFQAVGRMKVAMVAMMAGCLTNIVLDPVLIFGLGPAPALGIRGAALATGTGQVLTLAIYLVFYKVRPIPVRVSLAGCGLIRGKGETGAANRSGAAGTAAANRSGAAGTAAAGRSGGAEPAALSRRERVLVLGVYYKLQTFLYLPANGIVQGMRPVIGYNYGAGEKERVRRIYRTVLALIAVMMAAGTVICLALPEQLMGLFTTNPDTVAAGAQALRIISAGFIVSTVSVTSSGALEGLGKGVPSFVISALRYAVVIIPAAYLFSRFLGAAGVWWAFGFAEAVTAAAAYGIYRKESGR